MVSKHTRVLSALRWRPFLEAPLGLRINLTVATFLNGNLFVFTGATSMSSAFSPKNLIAWDVVEAPDGPVLIQWDRIILGESRLDWPAR